MSFFSRTIRIGGDSGVETNFDIGEGGDITVGGQKFNIGDFLKGGDGGSVNITSGGGGRGQKKSAFYSPPKSNVGRPSRKAKQNPFAGLESQSYDEIKRKCLQEGILFEDPEFPAQEDTIFFSRKPPRPFEWKRPPEICNDPQFLVEGASRFDVKQGELGDCWLLAAVASLTCDGKLFAQVVPPSQTFAQGDYAGIFKFQFWHQGQWAEVVVDDRLPTYYGQLSFMHSVDKNEFWSALLEKAYAKLNGSYESLKGGSTCEAMEDFTGGITEMYDLKSAPKNLFQIMLKAHERSSMMGCSIDADPGQLEAELSNGLIMGHAYSITNVIMADVNTPRMSGKIPLVRIRNPWGNEAEWKGAWSDKSPQWNMVPQSERQELGITFDDDGEFWMSFQDFSSNFQKLEICNLGPDSLDEETLTSRSKKKWEVTMEEGQWVPRQNAGGCRNYLNTFWTNPQFRVTVTDVDEDDDEDMCTLIIGLLQKDRRKKRKEGLDMLTIGYCIYKLTDANSGPLDVNFFKYNGSIAKSPTFINMRESCGRHKLPPGTYCIIPSTFEPGQKGDFLLRIFTEKINHTSEIDEPTGYVDQIRGGAKDRGHPYIPSYSGQAYAAPGIPNAYPAATPTSEDQDQEDAMKSQFRRTAGDDMEIDAYELQGILNAVFQKEFSFPGFSVDVCRSMVAMKDGDLSGKLGYDEFKILWNDLRRWKTVFKKFDEDSTGSLNSYELRAAFRHSGFTVSNRTLMALVMRYAKRDGTIEFGDFVACAVKLKTMIESFQSLEMKGTGKAVFNMDDFLQTTMYS